MSNIDFLALLWYNKYVDLNSFLCADIYKYLPMGLLIMYEEVDIMSAANEPMIMDMVNKVVVLCDPIYVYLVSCKRNSANNITSFKLCAVVQDDELPESVETKLLINTDCPVPCDFIVYNITDWDECADDDCSFAYRVENGGEKLYVKGR